MTSFDAGSVVGSALSYENPPPWTWNEAIGKGLPSGRMLTKRTRATICSATESKRLRLKYQPLTMKDSR